jgi:simple sugar transport system ATP-binding protein
VIQLSDRVVVLFEGRVMGDLAREEVTVEEVGLLMTGVSG